MTQRNDIPVYYDAGAYTETDRVLNFDLAKPFDSGTFGAVNVAVGLEYRDETFRIDNGEPNSFFIDPNLAAQGFGVGSNGFPGFQPGDAGENTVRAFAAYIDVESNVSENLLLGGAMRYENYAEFGNTLDGQGRRPPAGGGQHRRPRRRQHRLPGTDGRTSEPAQT